MTTLPDLRTRLRQVLHDAGSSQRWDDETLDGHLTYAIEELSQAMPRQLIADVATTPGSRQLSLAGLDGLIAVASIEYPIDDASPRFVSFETWGGMAAVLGSPVTPTGDNARVRYTAHQLVDDSASTLSAFQEELVITGASGFATLGLAAGAIDTLTTGGADVPRQLQSWGQARLIAFRQLLYQYGSRPLRAGRLRQAG